MPDIIELNELLTGIQAVLDEWDSSTNAPKLLDDIQELMDATWIRAWLDD